MFAPYPNKSDSFLVVPGVLASGKLVDVYDLVAGAPSFEKPDVLFDAKFKTIVGESICHGSAPSGIRRIGLTMAVICVNAGMRRMANWIR